MSLPQVAQAAVSLPPVEQTVLERAEAEAEAVTAEPAAAGPAGSQLTPYADVVVRFVLRAAAGPGLHTGVVGLVLASCCIPL